MDDLYLALKYSAEYLFLLIYLAFLPKNKLPLPDILEKVAVTTINGKNYIHI